MGQAEIDDRFVEIRAGGVTLQGSLSIPRDAAGIVIFVHGSGSSRLSPRNQFVARDLRRSGGLGTLLFDLLTREEEQIDLVTRALRFDIDLLARRTVAATDWLFEQPYAGGLPIGFFGASTGAAAALIASVERPAATKAVVSRGGRPDLASAVLDRVGAPTLLIVGGLDDVVIDLNQQAFSHIRDTTEKELVIVPGATHLFEEPGALEQVARLAREWFTRHLQASNPGSSDAGTLPG